MDATPLPPDFGALIAQRLCHDLVSPLGAVGNGLELLAMTQPETPEMALMRDSLDQALGRIRLYRLAFGPGSAAGNVAGTELVAALGALGGSRRIELITDLPTALPRDAGRLLALLALCAETALAWGGGLTVAARDGLTLTAEAPRLKLDPEPWAALGAGVVPADPRPPLVQFALVPAAAAALGRRVAVETGPGRIVLTA